MRDGIVVVNTKDYIQARCCDYEAKDDLSKYQKPLTRTAKQSKSIMGFTQFY